MCLHVQTSNTDAIEFYTKRGFVLGEEVKDYYKRIEPPHAYVLRYKIPTVESDGGGEKP